MAEEYYPATQGDPSDAMRYDLGQATQPYGESHSELAKWQLEVEDILRDMEHAWRGETKDDNGLYVSKTGSVKVMNEEGIQKFLGFMRQTCKNLFLSNYNKKDIKFIMYNDVFPAICSLILEKHEDFNLAPEDFDLVAWPAIQFIESGMNRALDGGERKSLTESTKTITSIMNRPVEKVKRRFGFL